jgi:condensin-2 complex subunit D3
MASISESLRALLGSARNAKNLSQSREDDDDLPDDDVGEATEDVLSSLCINLIQSLEVHLKQRSGINDEQKEDDGEVDGPTEISANSFIHTRLDYNNKRKQAAHHPETSFRAKHAPFSDTNVREVFDDHNTSISQLPPLLSSLMMTRVEFEKLLPETQDAEANEAAMDSAALTLTKPALTAARLYATLLAIPGALGSGVIQMGTVSSLAALFRGWRREATTAMGLLLDNKKGAQNKKSNSKLEGRGKRRAKSTITNPVKRGKGRKRVQVVDGFVNSDDDNEEEDDGSKLQMGEDNSIIPAKELVMLGMEAGIALSQVLWQKEFLSWSIEAREAVVDAVTSLHGTAAALVTPSLRTKLPGDLIELQEEVVKSTALCLQQCIRMASVEEENEDAEGTSPERHETSVFIFRGLYAVIAMREHLPNGTAGQQCACEVATETLRGFIKGLAVDMGKQRGKANNLEQSAARLSMTPSTIRSQRHKARFDAPTTPVTTNRNGRKKRVSFGALDTARKTPMLKSGNKRRMPGVTPGRSPGGGATPRPVFSAALGLMQKLATSKGLERAVFRRSITKTLQSCLQCMPPPERTHFLRFMSLLCASKVSVHRLLVVELVSVILAEAWLWEEHSHVSMIGPNAQPNFQAIPTSPVSPSSPQGSPSSTITKDNGFTIPMSLLESLIGRLDDRAPAVRACAASAFSQLFRQVAEVTQDDTCNEEEQQRTIIEASKALASRRYSIVYRLRQRALEDDNAVVRRTSINALAEVISLGTADEFPFKVGEEEVAAFGHLCGDNSTAARKAAAQALTSILKRCNSMVGENGSTLDIVARTWTASVLPMALDSDATCVSKALDLVNQVMIQPIVTDQDELSGRQAAHVAWKILSFVCESAWSGAACTATNALKVALGKLTTVEAGAKDLNMALVEQLGFLAAQTTDGALDHIAPEIEWQTAGVWFLLDTVVDQTRNLSALIQALIRLRVDLDFLSSSWQKMLQLLDTKELSISSENTWRCCLRSCLNVLAKLSPCISNDVAQHSASKLRTLLHGFSLPPDLIGSAVSALTATFLSTSGRKDPELARKEVVELLSSMYSVCEDSINAFAQDLLEKGQLNLGAVEEVNIRAIFLVGELSTVGFCPDDDVVTKEVRGTKNDPIRGLNVPPSRKLVEGLLMFLPPPSKCVRTPKSIRAHAFIAVGKLCIRNEALAKKCVKIMAQELNEHYANECCSAKNNALLVLGDLCIRYTSLVDKYLPVMARCLQTGVDEDNALQLTTSDNDKSAIVRKNAVILLSGLILQVKLAGVRNVPRQDTSSIIATNFHAVHLP